MSSSPQWIRTGATFVVVSLLVAACGETAGSEYSDLPVLEVHGDDFQSFTVEELAANSDLIVVGTISAVALSELTPPPELEDFGGERNFLVTLDVETVIGGALNGDLAVTIEVYGLQVDEGGEPEAVYVVNGMPVPLVGSTEVWFLREREPGLWGFTDADDARFARSGDTLTALATTAGPAARKIENLGFNGLVDELN